MKTLLICSGGLDSVTLAYKIAKEHKLMGLLSFNYGQRHSKELYYARLCADDLGAAHYVLDISPIGALLSGSALTSDDVPVPDGHYAEDTMKITVVPNRNAIMLSIAYGIACSKGLEAVAAAFHGGDHFIYPDCRPEFAASFGVMQDLALDGVGKIALYTPFITQSKADIVRAGNDIGVPFVKSWSCYKGGEIHCGRCGTCVERQEAFALAGVEDPTQYADSTYWKQATGQGA